MATLASRISDLATAIRDKFNQIMPRLLPPGGASGQALTKASSSDNSVQWSDVYTPSTLTFGNGLRKSGAAVTTTGASTFMVSGVPSASQTLAVFYMPYTLSADINTCGGFAKTAPAASYAMSLKRQGVTMVTWTWAAGMTSPTVGISNATLNAGNYTLEAQATADTAVDSPSPTLGFFR